MHPHVFELLARLVGGRLRPELGLTCATTGLHALGDAVGGSWEEVCRLRQPSSVAGEVDFNGALTQGFEHRIAHVFERERSVSRKR